MLHFCSFFSLRRSCDVSKCFMGMAWPGKREEGRRGGGGGGGGGEGRRKRVLSFNLAVMQYYSS